MALTELPIRVEPTAYMVTKYPEEGVNGYSFTLQVERRAPGQWCVTDGAQVYRKDGHATYEPQPSSRTDRFKKAYRFPLEQALEIAKKVVAKRAVMGKTAEEMWEWEQQPK